MRRRPAARRVAARRVAARRVAARRVARQSKISSLNVGNNHIVGDGADFLAKMVLKSASLTDFCGISLVSLRENSVTELDLSKEGIGVPGAIVLSSLMPAALKSLNISGNELGVEGAKVIADLLETNTTLTSIDLASNQLIGIWGNDMSGMIKLCEALPQSKITSLNLRYNELGEEGAKHIAKMLEVNKTLTSVNICGSKTLGVESAKIIADLLETNTTLTSIDLDGHPLEVMKLRGTESVESIDLSSKRLTAVSGIVIASLISSNSATKSLNLASNELTRLTNRGNDMSAVIKLSEALPQSKITSLNLDNNSLEAEGAQIVVDLLKTNTTLTSVGLRENHFGGLEKEQLREAAGDRIKIDL